MKSLIRALDLTAGAFVALVVLATILGGVVTFPLNRAGLLWPYYWALTGVAVAALISMPPRRWLRWGPWAFLAPVGVLLAWLPYAIGVAPDARAADIEVRRLLLALLIAAIVFAPVRGSRAGMVGLRTGWALGLAVSVAVGLWEIATQEHLPLDPRGWIFGPARLAVGTFINPNNFATALVGMIVGTLALRAGLRWRRMRAALDVLVGLGAVVVVFTQSRAGLGALLVVGTLEAWRRLGTQRLGMQWFDAQWFGTQWFGTQRLGTRRLGASIASGSPLPVNAAVNAATRRRSPACRCVHGCVDGCVDPAHREQPAHREHPEHPEHPEPPEHRAQPQPRGRSRSRRLLGAGAAVLALLVLASITVPALATRNPLVQLWQITFSEETTTSDSLRVGLIRAALRYLRDSGWLGAGAGSFEPLLGADPDPGVTKLTNLHNAFVEILSQYGVIVAAVHAVAMFGLLGVVLRRGGGPARRDTRAEIAGYLMAYVAFGVTASSSLTTPTWWLLYVAACAAWWTSPAQARQAQGGDVAVTDPEPAADRRPSPG